MPITSLHVLCCNVSVVHIFNLSNVRRHFEKWGRVWHIVHIVWHIVHFNIYYRGATVFSCIDRHPHLILAVILKSVLFEGRTHEAINRYIGCGFALIFQLTDDTE